MQKRYLSLLLLSLISCKKDSDESAITLLGEWHVHQHTSYFYSPTGTLLSQSTSPGGATEKLLVTDSTLTFLPTLYADPAPGTPVPPPFAQKYTLHGDTIRLAKQARYLLITTLTSSTLTLHRSDKAYTTAAGYAEGDTSYKR